MINAVEMQWWEAECTRLCVDFAWAADAKHYHACVALFTADAVFEHVSGVYCGHEAILNLLKATLADVRTRHICTNISIQRQDEDHATGTSSILFFQGADGPETEPVKASAALVAEHRDVYVRVDERWLISERKTVLVFTN